MNSSIFLRLVWKEYRLQRSLWIAMALLIGLLLALVHLFALNETERFSWQLLLGTSLPALYCLGAGSILFAGEREADTYEFQRSLPVGAARVFAAKMTFALLGAAAMFILFGLALLILRPAGAFEPTELSHQYAAGVAKRMPLLAIVLLFWAIFFSLLLRRVLVAAVLGVVVGSVYFDAACGWYSKLWGDFHIAPELIVSTVAIALADLWLGVRWFRQRKERCREPKQSSLDAAVGSFDSVEYAVIQTNGAEIPVGSDRLIIIGRLVWQHWRQSARLILMLVGLTLLPLIMICIGWLVMSEPPTSFWQYKTNGANCHFISSPISFIFDIVPAFLGVSLLGLIAFHADQWKRGYRFLADRGVPPKYVWLSRQLLCWGSVAAALPALLAAALFLAPTVIDSCIQNVGEGEALPVAQLIATTCTVVIGYLILSVAVGQFLSMFFRSGILAGLFSIIFTLILAAWCGLMWLWDVNWLWSMLPIPAALLLATRLRMHDWILERNTFRAWLRPGLALAIPTVVLLVAVPMYRIYQIPYVDPGFSPDEFAREMTPEERATLAQYEEAIQKYNQVTIDSPSDSYDPEAEEAVRKEAIALAISASSGKLFDPDGKFRFKEDFLDLATCMISFGNELEYEGKLNEALERYLAALRIVGQYRDWYDIRMQNIFSSSDANYVENLIYKHLATWASSPKQTPERILAAERDLKKITDDFSMENNIKLTHMRLRRFLEGDVNAIDLGMFVDLVKPALLSLRFSWERKRALRLLHQRTDTLLKLSKEVDSEAELGQRLFQHEMAVILQDSRDLYRIGPYLNCPVDDLISDWLYFGKDETVLHRQKAAVETNRRATRIILALEAWKLQHGSLPKKLDELVGTCFDKLPSDPYTGEPFQYFPDGVKYSFSSDQRSVAGVSNTVEILAGEPFLWVAGPNVTLRQYPGVGQEIDLHRYAILALNDYYRVAWRRPKTENEIWSFGLVFPIP